MRPWKVTRLVPVWPLIESLPRITVRLQLGRLRFFRVVATQRPLTLRPPIFWVKVNAMVVGSSTVSEKTVPTGADFFARPASFLPPRQVRRDWLRLVSTGATGNGAW